jgi:tape measure domain-containing protein
MLGSAYGQIIIDGSGVRSGVKEAQSALGSFQSTAQGILQFATGQLVAVGFQAVMRGLMDMGREAIQSASDLQNLTISLETLAAREISRGELMTETSTQIRQLTAEETEQLGELQLSYQELGYQVEIAADRYATLAERHGEESAEAGLSLMKLQELQRNYADTGAAIAALSGQQGQLVTTSRQVRVGTMSIEDAMGQAKGRAQELLNQLRDLSLVSPFEYRQVADTFRLNMAFGATSDTAMELTGAVLDTASALGLSGDMLNRVSYNLAQALVQGDLTAANMRQLRMVGLDLADVFSSTLGMSVEDVSAALESGRMTMEEVSSAFVQYAGENFGGAAERMSRTFSGLKSSINDLFFFAGADLVTPALEEMTGFLGTIFDEARGLVTSGLLANIGADLGAGLQSVLGPAKSVLNQLGRLKTIFTGLGAEAGTMALVDMIFPPEAQAGMREAVGFIFDVFDQVSAFVNTYWPPIRTAAEETWGSIQATIEELAPVFEDAFARMGSAWGTMVGEEMAAGAGFIPTLIEGIGALAEDLIRLAAGAVPFLADAFTFLTDNWEYVAAAAGVVAAVLLAMEAPAALVAAAVAALYLAWQNDWGGIRTTLMEVWAQVQPALAGMWEWLSVNVPLAIASLKAAWETQFLPALQTVWEFIQINLLPILTDLWNWLSVNVPLAIQTLQTAWETQLLPALQTVWDFIQANVVPILTDLWNWLSANLPTAIQALQEAWDTRLRPALELVASVLATVLGPALTGVAHYAEVVKFAVNQLAEYWERVLLPVLRTLYDYFQTAIMPILRTVADVISNYVGIAVTGLAAYWQNVLQPALAMVWSFFQDNIIPILESVGHVMNAVLGVAVRALTGLWENVLLPAIRSVWQFIDDHIMPIFHSVTSAIRNALGPAFQWLGDHVLPIIQGALDGIGEVVQTVTGWLNTLAEKITGLGDSLPSWLQPGSPTPLELGLVGIRREMEALARMGVPQLATSLTMMPALAGAVAGGSAAALGASSGAGARNDNRDYGTSLTIETVVLQGVQDAKGLIEQLYDLSLPGGRS